MPGSRSASAIPAPARCILSQRSIRRAAHCAPCSACSKASPPAPPTATRAWPTSPPPPAAPGLRPRQWPGQPAQRAQGQGAGGQHRRRPRHLPRAASTPSCNRTSRPWRAMSRPASCAPRRAPPTWQGRRRRPRRGALTPGQVATLILPADVSWGEGGVCRAAACRLPPLRWPMKRPSIRSPPSCNPAGAWPSCWGNSALREPALLAAARIAAKTGAKLLSEVFPTRLDAAPACRPSSASPTWPSWPACNCARSTTWCWSTPRRRCPSSPTRARRATWCRHLHAA
jgi:hypothetical protein